MSNVRFSDSDAVIEREKYVGLTTDQLVYWTDKIKNVSIGTDDVRRRYLYPLANLGIINIVKSTINGNEILVFPVDSKAPLSAIFTDENDLRLKIDDPALYPTKSLLEEEFRTFIKHDAKEGGKNNERFLILDPDGNELTVDELIDRYLNNPEICFIQNYVTPATQDDIAMANLNNHLYTQQLIKIFNKNTPPTWRRDLQQFHNNNSEESSIVDSHDNSQKSNTESEPTDPEMEHVLPGGKTISQLKRENAARRKAIFKAKLEDLGTRPLGKLLEELRSLDVGILTDYLTIMKESPSISEMLELQIKRVIDEKDKVYSSEIRK